MNRGRGAADGLPATDEALPLPPRGAFAVMFPGFSTIDSVGKALLQTSGATGRIKKMRATKRESRGVGVCLLLLLAALCALPVSASLPTIDRALGDPASQLLEDLDEALSTARARAAEPSFELFPASTRAALSRGPVRVEAPRDLKTRVWDFSSVGSEQPQWFQLFNPQISVGMGIGPNLYQYAGNEFRAKKSVRAVSDRLSLLRRVLHVPSGSYR